MRRALVPVTLLASFASACDDDSPKVGGEDVSLCALSCDDEDFCTEDRCEPTTGACIHVPRDAANACTQDRHCDDGDPCTTDACGTDAECGFKRCQHTLLPGCRSCVGFAGCDDGNHCTTDTCGVDKLCRYTEEPTCDGRCRTWGVSMPSGVYEGATAIYGRAEPKGGRSCTSGCDCAPDLVLTDDYGQVSLSDADGQWSCALSGVCVGALVASCDPLRIGREYVVWGQALAERDRAGAAPMPTDTAPQADVGMPPPGPLASRVQVEGYCMAPTANGVAGRYAATLALDGEPDASFEVELDGGTNWRVLGTGALSGQSGYFEAWTGTTIVLYLSTGALYLRADLYPGADRLVGPVVDPSRGADAKPDVPTEPPPNPFGTRVGTLTLVLVP